MEPSLPLAPHTGKVFEAITRLECIKPFTLVGGTALSLQIAKRQSEDLDFMKWISSKKEKAEIDWPRIKNELESIGEKKSYDVMGFDYVKFDIEGVKLSFYAAPRTMIPSMKRIHYVNNLFLADMESIGVMKMETMLRRAKFRDYYDIYSILQEGCSIDSLMQAAIEHSGYKLKLRGLLAMLTNGALFCKDQDFELLQPVYSVSSHDIQEYIKKKLFECQDEKLRKILTNS